MEWGLLFTGVLIGIAVAAPIGPINLMCIQRTLQGGFWAGLATGIGAVLGDGLFAVVSAFGVNWIAQLVAEHKAWLQGAGGLIMVLMGVITIMAKPASAAPTIDRPWLVHGGLIGTTFLLTITNPATLFGFAAIFSGLGSLASLPSSTALAAQLVAAVMVGSLLWWVFVSQIVNLFRERFSSQTLIYINRVSGLIILVFGLVVLANVSGLRQY